MSNLYLQSFQNFKFGIYFHQKNGWAIFIMIWALNLNLGLKSFPVACKLRNILHLVQAV